MHNISLIAAVDQNFLIGKERNLPWGKLPVEMLYMRGKTIGKPIIMGRKTFESIGKPLPDRINIIVTKNPDFRIEAKEGCLVCVAQSYDEALRITHDFPEIMIFGGESAYAHFLPFANRLYLSFIEACFDGDVYFPITRKILEKNWVEKLSETIRWPADALHRFAITFKIFERK